MENGTSGYQPGIVPRIERCLSIALDALFPMRCAVCSVMDETGLCPKCSASVPRVESPCMLCGAPLGPNQGPARCGRCQARPPAFDATIAPFTYAPPLSGIVHGFKYRRRMALARPLARILASEIRSHQIELPELLVPVPLHWSRLMQRGFNQSLELCRHLSSELGIPYSRNSIRKKRKTASQVNLPLRDRRRNIQHAFSVQTNVRKRSIAIVDDVITSGETMRQLATRLDANAGTHTQCWAILRTQI